MNKNIFYSLLLLISLNVKAQSKDNFAAIKDIAIAQVQFCGRTEEFPPYSYSKGTAIEGFSVELIQNIFKEADLKTDIKVWPWNRSYEAALRQKNCYVFSTSRTPERESQFKWVGPIATDTVYLAALATSTLKPNTSYQSFNKYKVLGYTDDLPVKLLQKSQFEVIVPSSEKTRFEIFKSGRVPLDIVTSSSKEINEKTYAFKYKILSRLYDTEYWAAFNKETDDVVIAKLQAALNKLKKSPKHQELIQKYQLNK